jgi:hypothetical protein
MPRNEATRDKRGITRSAQSACAEEERGYASSSLAPALTAEVGAQTPIYKYQPMAALLEKWLLF